MEGNLVIVESPAKAKTIQKFLGEGYTVKASFGHIRDLQEKSISIDLEHGFKPEYVIPADKKKVVADLKKAASAAETVWLASDEDREGEAISWHLVETLGLDPSKTRRIAFHEITKPAILAAIKSPRSIDMNLVNAQQARRVLDRLVGFELSPVLWRKIKPQLSAGRVQSVALRLVVDREKEIMAFESKPYYRVEGLFKTAGESFKGTLDTRFQCIEDVQAFLQDSIGANYSVDSIDKKEGVRVPAAPFTTSTLQQEAARKLHFPVSLTMRVAQSLYERGLITYMRTDSTNLSSLAINTAKEYIIGAYGESYSHPRQYKTKSKGAQEAHEAIRPTYIANLDIEGTAQEKKLYQLVWKRTVASQMAEAKVLNSSMKIASDKRSEKYASQAVEVLFDGFLKLYFEGSDDVDDEQQAAVLPPLNPGDKVTCGCVNAECKFTQPPYRYSEQTLVRKMEELGIGRPSTYAPTISTLTTARGYLVKGDKEGSKVNVTNLMLKNGVISTSAKTEVIGAEKGKLLPQEIGLIVSDFLVARFNDIMQYDFTADVEKDFDQIAAGEMAWNNVIENFYTPFHSKVEEVRNDGQYSRVSREIGVAPDGDVLTGKFGQYGPYIQKGDASKRLFAKLGNGQLIESITLEEALKLFELPRVPGVLDGKEVVIRTGRFGPYINYDGRNISLPKKSDPMRITLEECAALINADGEKQPAAGPLMEFEASDIKVMNGRYGPYIKHAGSNYKIPSGVDAATLTEDDCKKIIQGSEPTKKTVRRFKKK